MDFLSCSSVVLAFLFTDCSFCGFHRHIHMWSLESEQDRGPKKHVFNHLFGIYLYMLCLRFNISHEKRYNDYALRFFVVEKTDFSLYLHLCVCSYRIICIIFISSDESHLLRCPNEGRKYKFFFFRKSLIVWSGWIIHYHPMSIYLLRQIIFSI